MEKLADVALHAGTMLYFTFTSKLDVTLKDAAKVCLDNSLSGNYLRTDGLLRILFSHEFYSYYRLNFVG